MGFKDTFFSKNLGINCRGYLLELSRPKVMGILNMTPDSFHDGGKYLDIESMKKKADRLIKEGSDIIDIGGVSSRPGSRPVEEKKELRRVEPAVEYLRTRYPGIPISLDTFRTGVAARMAEKYEIEIVNDITGGEGDPEMFSFIASSGLVYVLMHMQGIPENMQNNPEYKDIIDDLLEFFSHKIEILNSMGVKDIIIDPGFGFGKTIDHNYEVLSAFDVFRIFGLPLLAGISRKSMITRYLNLPPEKALNGSTALHMVALLKGANILRVHDVAEARQVISLYNKLEEFQK